MRKSRFPRSCVLSGLVLLQSLSSGASRARAAVDAPDLELMKQENALKKDIQDKLQTEMRAKQQEKMKVEQEKMKAVAEVNKKEGAEFLEANKTKEGVVVLPSGLQYKILTASTGPKPAATDTVSCNYRGTLLDGTEFDSSYKRGQPTSFPVNGVIKGWTEALQLMPVGSKWQLFIPSDLAYGDRGADPRSGIGPGATLIFEVELLSIQDKSKPEVAPKQ